MGTGRPPGHGENAVLAPLADTVSTEELGVGRLWKRCAAKCEMLDAVTGERGSTDFNNFPD